MPVHDEHVMALNPAQVIEGRLRTRVPLPDALFPQLGTRVPYLPTRVRVRLSPQPWTRLSVRSLEGFRQKARAALKNQRVRESRIKGCRFETQYVRHS